MYKQSAGLHIGAVDEMQPSRSTRIILGVATSRLWNSHAPSFLAAGGVGCSSVDERRAARLSARSHCAHSSALAETICTHVQQQQQQRWMRSGVGVVVCEPC